MKLSLFSEDTIFYLESSRETILKLGNYKWIQQDYFREWGIRQLLKLKYIGKLENRKAIWENYLYQICTKKTPYLNYAILPKEKKDWNKSIRNRHDSYRTLGYEERHHQPIVKKIRYSKNSVGKTLFRQQSGGKKVASTGCTAHEG